MNGDARDKLNARLRSIATQAVEAQRVTDLDDLLDLLDDVERDVTAAFDIVRTNTVTTITKEPK